jgi:hypothetical protein
MPRYDDLIIDDIDDGELIDGDDNKRIETNLKDSFKINFDLKRGSPKPKKSPIIKQSSLHLTTNSNPNCSNILNSEIEPIVIEKKTNHETPLIERLVPVQVLKLFQNSLKNDYKTEMIDYETIKVKIHLLN